MDFSVIIPAHNVSAIIERAIRSVAAQTLPPREILVIDDCSTDDTVEVVKALGREIPSIRLLSTPKNSGPAAARNVGLREAKADWIALLDADDAWKSVRLERLSETAVTTSADVAADNLVLWDPVADAMFKPSYYKLAEPQKQITLLDMFRADDNFDFTKASLALMKPIFRRKFLVDHKLEYNESIRVGEDFVIVAECLFNKAKLILIDEAHYIWSAPRGPSGRSPHSRTVYHYGDVIRGSRLLSEKYHDRIDPTLKSAISDYRKTMTLLQESDIARNYKRSGRYTQYVAYLAARPELTRRLIFRAARNLRKKMRPAPAG